MSDSSPLDGKTPCNHRGQVEGKREMEKKKGRGKEGTDCPQQILLTYFEEQMATECDVIQGTQFSEIWQSPKQWNGFYGNLAPMHILPRKQ